MQVYYHYPIPLDFHSGMAIQVAQDYRALNERGVPISVFGCYNDRDSFNEFCAYVRSPTFSVLSVEGHSHFKRNLLKMRFMNKMFWDRGEKIIISRHLNKIVELIRLRKLWGNARIVLEMHEDAFPHLLKKDPRKAALSKKRYEWLFRHVDACILTNDSQEVILKQEFSRYPSYLISPNGVRLAAFQKATPSRSTDTFVVTYTGQFTSWKNVELLFASLALLDERFSLRIAGGKGTAESEDWVRTMARTYGVGDRVDYRGFVCPARLIPEVISGSSALLLPLGDNVASRYLTSPMKLFEYMATPIPVVAVDYPSVNLLVGNDLVYLAENSSEHFAQAIQRAVLEKDAARIQKMNARAKEFSYDVKASRLHDYFQHLLQDTPQRGH